MAGQNCRGCTPLGFAGEEVPAFRACLAVRIPLPASLPRGHTRSSPAQTSHTPGAQTGTPVLSPIPQASPLSPQSSWLCSEMVWVPCRVSAPAFSPLSEMCKQQRLLLGERHRCSCHRSSPASHPGPRQAARAGDTQHLSRGEGDESLENRPRHRARAGRRWSCEASIFGSGGIGVIRATRSSLPTQK